MKKKNFARLLAFVMSAALVLQPVAVYATEQGEGDITDPVENVGELPSEEATIEQPELTTTVPEVVPKITASVADESDVSNISDTYQDRELITEVTTTSDIASIFVLNGGLKPVTFNCDNEMVSVSQYEIQKEKNGEFTTINDFGEVTEGKYRVFASVDMKNQMSREYALSSNVKLLVDGKEWTYEQAAILVDGFLMSAIFRSPEIVITQETLPALQNVYIEGDKLYWDPIVAEPGQHILYVVTTNGQGDYYADPPVNLIDQCAYLNVSPGEVTVTLEAVDFNAGDESLSAITELKYVYQGGSNKTPLTSVNTTSDADQIFVLGAPATQVSVELNNFNILYEFNGWREKSGDDWNYILTGTRFQDKSYKYDVTVKVAPFSSNTYCLDPDFELTVDGKKFTPITIKKENSGEVSSIKFESPEYTFKPASEKTVIESAKVKSNYKIIPKVDAQIQFPYFEFEEWDTQLAFIGTWYKEESDGSWQYYNSGTFTPGNWRFEGFVSLSEKYASTYELSPDFELEVAGQTWEKAISFGGGDPVFTSETFTLEKPAEMNLITEVTATSDIADIFVLNGEFRYPTYTLSDDRVSVSQYDAVEVIGQKVRPINLYGEVTAGIYKCSVVLTVKTDTPLKNAFSEDVRLIVDGTEWIFVNFIGDTDGYLVTALFESPGILVSGEEPPVIIDAGLTNVYIVGDYLYWDLYNGMHSGYDIQINGESDGVYKIAPYDLKTACDDMGIAKGIVSVRIAAVLLDDDYSVIPLTPYVELKYNYGGAESGNVLSTASATSNYESIPQLGKPIEQPTFDIEGDLPIEVKGNWFKETENDTWDETDFDQFTAGKWRYEACIQFTADDIDYKLSDDFSLQVNGKTWDKEIIKIDTGDFILSTCIFYSEVFDIEGSREIIGEINATSDLQEILVYGNKLIVPHFESGNEKVWVYNSHIERDDGEGFHWIEMGEEYTVIEGRYRAFVQVEVPKNCYDDYAISDSTKLTVNGTEWKYYETLEIREGDVITATYVSPDFAVSAGTPAAPEGGKWIQKYGASYYETPDGKKATGMQKIGTETYLFSKNGTLQKNAFYESEGKKFYFGSEGKLTTGWFSKWSATYYADDEGVIQTGFTDIEDKTYYFKADGRMTVSTWITVGGDKYYSKADGHLAKSETILKWGKKYTFDDRGVLIN